MPLNAEGKARRVGDADGLDRAVLRHALDDNPLAGLEDALTVQRVDADGLLTEELREGAAGDQVDIVAVGEDDGGSGGGLAPLPPPEPGGHAPGPHAGLGTQRSAPGGEPLPQTSAE